MNDIFWSSQARLITSWRRDRFGFVFNDPRSFSKEPANAAVFPKIIEQLGPAGTIDESAMARLLYRFASSCTREEWKEVYRPVLARTERPAMTLGEYNQQCPPEFRIVPVRAAPFVPYDPKRHKLDGNWVYSPVPQFDGKRPERGFVLITHQGVEILSESFVPYQSDQSVDDLCLPDLGDESVDFLIEFVPDESMLMAIDLIPLNSEYPTSFRAGLLEDYHSHMDMDGILSISERFPFTNPEQAIDMYQERGFPRGLLCKQDCPYNESEIVIVNDKNFPREGKTR